MMNEQNPNQMKMTNIYKIVSITAIMYSSLVIFDVERGVDLSST